MMTSLHGSVSGLQDKPELDRGPAARQTGDCAASVASVTALQDAFAPTRVHGPRARPIWEVEAFQAKRNRRAGQRGSALLIVLILLALMGAIVVSNSVVLRHLKRELNLIEQRQRQKAAADPKTNQTARPTTPETPRTQGQ